MKRVGALIGVIVATTLFTQGSAADTTTWRTLQPGVEYRAFATGNGPDSLLHVVRVDPSAAKVLLAPATAYDKRARTAKEWCSQANLAVCVNAGMFSSDGLSNVGYLRAGKHANNPKWNVYRSALCIYPNSPSMRLVQWLDLDPPHPPSIATKYTLVVQNLRLIKAPRKNVWGPSHKKWSEAAIGIDSEGRLLFLFSRCPYTMSGFNQLLLSLPLEIQQAMHVEGGPEASLSIHTGGMDLDLCGSYETGFMENDSNLRQWDIPNALGVAR